MLITHLYKGIELNKNDKIDSDISVVFTDGRNNMHP